MPCAKRFLGTCTLVFFQAPIPSEDPEAGCVLWGPTAERG